MTTLAIRGHAREPRWTPLTTALAIAAYLLGVAVLCVASDRLGILAPIDAEMPAIQSGS